MVIVAYCVRHNYIIFFNILVFVDMKAKGGNQQGFIGTAINDIKNNNNVLQPVYDTTASIGIVYNLMYAIFGTIFMCIFLFIGVWLLNLNSDKTETTTGIYKDVKCSENKVYDSEKKADVVEKSCVGTIEYKVNGKEYNKLHQTKDVISNGQNVKLYYNPNNPNDFVTETSSYYIGLILIIVSVCIIVIMWIWTILSFVYKPVAAASGVGAIGDALT